MAARCSACNKVTGRCSCEYDTHRDTPMTTPDLRSALTDELSEEWQSVERAIWPNGPASGSGSGVYAALKAKVIAALSQPEPLDAFIEEVDAALRQWKRPIIGATTGRGFASAQEAQSTEAIVRINAARARLSETPR